MTKLKQILTKADKRAQQHFKNKNQPQGATLSSQTQHWRDSNFYQKTKKISKITIK
ncbi:MAG: hypothetical protein PHS07_00900 [Patescibacteria group bacterium]|jgi:hypothetical protein|nr:hypothetical protein [Patescibacteria group bacterium]